MNAEQINSYFIKVTNKNKYITNLVTSKILYCMLQDNKSINLKLSDESKNIILDLEQQIRECMNRFGTYNFKTALRGHMLRAKVYMNDINVILEGEYSNLEEIKTRQVDGFISIKLKGVHIQKTYIQPCFEILEINGNYMNNIIIDQKHD